MATEKTNSVATFCTKNSWNNEKTSTDLSDLARIEIKSDDPLDLFKEWHEAAKKYSTGMPNALCLATVSKTLKVSARHVLLRHYDEQGFVIVTDNRSRKSHELEEVPSAAMCILWAYPNDRNNNISRQVRIEGKIEKLWPEDFRHLYEREPLYCKIRSHLCWQGKLVDWDEQKIHHDKLVQEVSMGKRDLPMPDHFIAYRLTPDQMEYYFAYDHLIADRLLFKKESGIWTNERIAARDTVMSLIAEIYENQSNLYEIYAKICKELMQIHTLHLTFLQELIQGHNLHQFSEKNLEVRIDKHMKNE